jgi:hypothetical protein
MQVFNAATDFSEDDFHAVHCQSSKRQHKQTTARSLLFLLLFSVQYLFSVDFTFASCTSAMVSVVEKTCEGCDFHGLFEGTLCQQCSGALTSTARPSQAIGQLVLQAAGIEPSETVQEKTSKVLQQLSSAVDQLQGVDGTSQHAAVHIAHTLKEVALQGYGTSKDEMVFKQKVASATSAFLHAKLQDPGLSLKVSEDKLCFEKFNPDEVNSVVVKEAFKFGQFKYISSPVKAFEVINEEEKTLLVESIQTDLHGKYPQQLHAVFTNNESGILQRWLHPYFKGRVLQW